MSITLVAFSFQLMMGKMWILWEWWLIRGLLWKIDMSKQTLWMGKTGLGYNTFFSLSFFLAKCPILLVLLWANWINYVHSNIHYISYIRGKMRASRCKNCIFDCSLRLHFSAHSEIETNGVKFFIEIDWT